MLERTPEQIEEIRKKAFSDKIKRLEDLGFHVTKTGDDGVTFFCKGTWKNWIFRNNKEAPLHLGPDEWNIVDHLIFKLHALSETEKKKIVQQAMEKRKAEEPFIKGGMYDIKSLHTRTLLRYLDIARKCGGMYDPCYSGGSSRFHPIYAEEIKKELATRPHIPNKKEAAVIRRNKLKQKKDRGGRRR